VTERVRNLVGGWSWWIISLLSFDGLAVMFLAHIPTICMFMETPEGSCYLAIKIVEIFDMPYRSR
jgi:hypothetical protein